VNLVPQTGAVEHPCRRIREWLFPIDEEPDVTIERRIILLAALVPADTSAVAPRVAPRLFPVLMPDGLVLILTFSTCAPLAPKKRTKPVRNGLCDVF
jgi:hypothetical protein